MGLRNDPKQCLDLYLKKLATDDLTKVVWTSDLNVGHDSGELSAFNTLVEKLHSSYGIDLSTDKRITDKAKSIDTDSYKNKADELDMLDKDLVISTEFVVAKPPPPAAPTDVTLRAPHIINSHGYSYSYVVYLDGAQIKPEIVTHLAGLVGKPPIKYTVWGAPKPILAKDASGKVTSAEIRITPMAIW